MFLKFKNKILIFVVSIIILSGYLFISSALENNKFDNLKSLLNSEQRQLIKKYIFPYKLISQQEKQLSQQMKQLSQQEHIVNLFNWSEIELKKKIEGSEIISAESIVKLSRDRILKKYKLTSGFYAGIHEDFPGSGYIDFYEGSLIVLSSRGILAFTNQIGDKKKFQQIKNNINEYIGIDQFNKNKRFSLKDIFIFNNKIFISYTEEIKEDCWNTSVIYGDMNLKNINFKKQFSSKKCVHSINNIDKEFNAHQSGGKITYFNDNQILLTVGDYKNRYLAQDIESINGKIIKINIDNSDYEIISMGHRNPQGLFFDKDNNFILETEHGPQGGDEINLIEISEINKENILNYGWPISSTGEHYGGKTEERNKKKYEKYPLYNSHIKHGFIKPLMSFVPSIGISEIVKIGPNKYVASSLKDKSLYFFDLNKEKEIINLNRLQVFERIRDLRFNNDQLYLFMEDTASIGMLKLNKN